MMTFYTESTMVDRLCDSTRSWAGAVDGDQERPPEAMDEGYLSGRPRAQSDGDMGNPRR